MASMRNCQTDIKLMTFTWLATGKELSPGWHSMYKTPDISRLQHFIRETFGFVFCRIPCSDHCLDTCNAVGEDKNKLFRLAGTHISPMQIPCLAYGEKNWCYSFCMTDDHVAKHMELSWRFEYQYKVSQMSAKETTVTLNKLLSPGATQHLSA